MAGKGGDFLAGAPGCPGWPGTLTAASLQPFGQSPIVCRAVPSSGCRPRGNSRRAPASFSEVVGEFFIYFFKIVWWLLLPLAQDFLASAQGELALNGKCN